MEKIDRFNIRVYGLLILEDALMILREPYAGEILLKFPGGGIEFGESLIEGLARELKEELNLELKSYRHFYTQEEFLVSKFKSNEQLLTIYYLIEVKNSEELIVMDHNIEEVIWIPMSQLTNDMVNLPIDQKVIEMLLKIWV
ncbi:MAG: NUDIX hydrolase [Flavobacteriaceae bacterium]|nr:NUDIX hydrolase [Flavobacteriaceae bacterium]